MHRALDFDRTPALRVPLPFLLNVPFFALLAGVLLTLDGSAALSSRWDGTTMALTHIWTLGIMGSAMLGALIQILPVACNVPVDHGHRFANSVYVLYTLGCLLLIGGFYFWQPGLFLAASIVLAIAFIVYFLKVGKALWRYRRQVYAGAREILVPVRAALSSLGITVILGLVMASALGKGFSMGPWLDYHVLWGLVGWGGLLLMGMSFQLIPIFQMTELYPKWLSRWLPLVVVIALLAWSSVHDPAGGPYALHVLPEFVLLACYATWAVSTLHLLHTRKRASHGPTSLFWFASMYSLLACVPAWAWHLFNPSSRSVMVLGVLIIVGGFGSVIVGQLYKIISFLLWKHAQDAVQIPDDDPTEVRRFLHVVPKMQAFIQPAPAFWHWGIHIAVIVSWVLAAMGWQLAGLVAGPLLVVAALLFISNLARAVRLYRNALKTIATMSQEA